MCNEKCNLLFKRYLHQDVYLDHKGNPNFQGLLNHGTVIRTGKTYKKIPCYMYTQLAIGLLLKKPEYFEVLLNIFEFSRVRENVES